MQLTFLGGVGTVTGSKYLVEEGNRRVLVDCGLFQGFKQLRLRNWDRFPVEPPSIDAVILTHAHLDHSGYLPLLVRNGFKGPVFCTSATLDLCSILLPDSGHLQERDAEYANRHGFSKHKPALPLYTEAEARASLDRFVAKAFDAPHSLGPGLTFRLRPSGHILGSAFVEIAVGSTTILFSGDLGRPNGPIMVDPSVFRRADYLLVESTYGDRTHDTADPASALAEVINRTARRGGVVLIPTFAVGRVQTILFYIHRLKTAGLIPDLPVYLDSPMAVDASAIFCNHLGEHRLTPQECRALCGVARYVNRPEESQALARDAMPKIILSASGMATGGRVLHHLKAFAPNPKNMILFAGFQAPGTRGATMVGGAPEVKIHGTYVPVRAEVRNIEMLSAHADSVETLAWLRRFDEPPKTTFVTHGEPAAADALRHAIEERLGWRCRVPEYLERVDLTVDPAK
ncbi:MAG: MBL fold metallo-hydrolase RNA specificity domain-containing protein [Pseudomonadota bacterium]